MCDSEPSFLPIDIPSPAAVAGGLFSLAWDCKAVFGALAIAGTGILAVTWVMANIVTIALIAGGLVAGVGGGTLVIVLALRRFIVPGKDGATVFYRRAGHRLPRAMQRSITQGRLAIEAPAPPLTGTVLTRRERTRTHAREGKSWNS